MPSRLHIIPLIVFLTLALVACGGGAKWFSDNISHPQQTIQDQANLTTLSPQDATRTISRTSAADWRREMLNDEPATAIMNRPQVEYNAVISYPEDALEVIEPEQTVYDESLPLVGSQSVRPGPSPDELLSMLDVELDRLGIDPAKTISAPPSGPENKVLDLTTSVVDPDGAGPLEPTGIELVWTEVFIGDYDQNGEVGISDLSPLGNKFFGTVTYSGDIPAGDPENDGGTGFGTPPVAGSGADNWRLWRIDGDVNGEINGADIVPIATHFAQFMSGYRIYRKGPGETNFTLLTNPADAGSGFTAPRSYAIPEGETKLDPNRPVRYHFVDETQSGDGDYEYYVVPFDATSSGEGVQSSPVLQNFTTAPLPVKPVAVLTAIPLSGKEPLTVSFDASASSDSDGTITEFEWDWNTDGLYEENTGLTATNSHEYTAAGNYAATVRVRDSQGLTDTDTVNIQVTANALPDIIVTATPSEGFIPLTVNFDASGTTDPDGTIAKFEWDWDGNDDYEEDTGTTATNSHEYTTAGFYSTKLRVTDNVGGTSVKTIFINAFDPSTNTLFDIALAGVEMERADLNLGDLPSQVGFTGYLNRGNDETGFDLNGDLDFDDPGEIVPGSRFGSFTNYWHDDHTALPTWSRGHIDALEAATSFETMIDSANDIFFEGDVRQNFFGPINAAAEYTPDGANPLGQAVIDLITNQGGTPNTVDILTDAADVPVPLQNALARILLASDGAATARNDFLENDIYWGPFFGAYDPGEPPASNIWHLAYNESHAFRVPIDISVWWPFILFGLYDDGAGGFGAIGEALANTYAYDELAQGAIDIAHALDQAEATLLGDNSGNYTFDQVTPIGRIVINSGGGTTVYTEDDYLMICDVDGDDTYNCTAGANASVLNPVSINLDLAGDDEYAALDEWQDAGGLGDDTHSQQGTGRMGIGMLIDYAGNDAYNASMASQGSGILGWGLLYDHTGNDTYSGVEHVQGSSLMGVGILFDREGQDSYECWNSSQGFGDIWGLGILQDNGSTDDTFYAEWNSANGPDIYAYPDDTSVYNANFVQGAAFGLRTTSSFPVIWDGGVGMLLADGGGNNLTCGAFGQGAGFWFGTGVMSINSGDNFVQGMQYVQGAATQYAAAIGWGGSGPDGYNNEWNTSGVDLIESTLGVANNYSVGWFLDAGGSDVYRTPGRGLGTGIMNGWAYFIDMGPDIDDYAPTESTLDSTTLGRGYLSNAAPDGDPRESDVTFGLFLDCGGIDLYDGAWASMENGDLLPVSAGNNIGWNRFGYTNDFANNWRSNEFGAGYDSTGDSGFEP